MIATEQLTKRYGEHAAVEALDLDVRPAEIYGFLGPNGAGKTTTIHMLLNLVRPTAGRVCLFGEPVGPGSFAYRRQIGVVAEEPVEISRMTGWEVVRAFARLCGVKQPEPRMEELFHALDLWDAREALAHDYSRGMRQKLSLIRALVHEPKLLILDEPVSGLDPRGIRQVREIVSAYQQRGGTVFISSHILSEIERTADRIGIMHQGRLLIEDTLAGIRQRIGRGRTLAIELASIPDSLVSRLAGEPGVMEVAVAESAPWLELLLDGQHDARAAISRIITEAGGVILGMESEEMSLEEAFVTITTQNVTRLAGAQ
ncbi:MAG: ABC transporter ATP-binding protein [Thermomicrobiales bacterium]|nr:ABC transporter ATP-binding protein [Thermomicrobiales bacterium]